jgi:PAS domain-containing protein
VRPEERVGLLERERASFASALRAAEERFRVVLEGSPIVVAAFARELCCTCVYNPPFGLAVADVLGQRLGAIDRADVAVLRSFLGDVLKGGVGQRRELAFDVDGGHAFDVTAEPLHDPDGQIVGLTMSAMDVTELRRTQRDLHEVIERAPVFVMIHRDNRSASGGTRSSTAPGW